MKKTNAITTFFLFLFGIALFATSLAEEAPATIMAGSSDEALFPFGKHQAVAMRYLDAEEEAVLSLVDASGVQSSIRFPCERGKFCFVPSSHVYSEIDENALPLLVPFSSLQTVANHGLSIHEE